MGNSGVLLDIYDQLARERDAALSRLGALETACIEARRWIEHNDDASSNGADRVLKLIRVALTLGTEESPMENDLDRIAASIDDCLSEIVGNSHEPHPTWGDSLTITKDGWIAGVIRLQRLRDYVEGLAQTHRAASREA